MDTFIQKEIQQRFIEMKENRSLSRPNQLGHQKSIIALALTDYMSQKRQSGQEIVAKTELDEHFVRIAANQIRLFIFAGNDSTASSIVYTFHCLFNHPNVLTKLRQEHDDVFGTTTNAADMLKENPALINKCSYTLAVIKETLRLYPPASSLRRGSENVSINDLNGKAYPTKNLGATIMHHFVHTNPRFWPRPKEFLPERWTVDPDHELYPSMNTGAYRPFEHGPRNCIGQTLVYNEMRIALILTARKFDVAPAYEEWDALQLSQEGVLKKLARHVGLVGNPVKTVAGERAYQTIKAGAHPADGYPCLVTLAKH
jgi:cytochrome P450